MINTNQRLVLSEFSEDELTDVIEEATRLRENLRKSRKREAAIGPYGSKGQDVRDPDHGVIPVPTPNEVEKVGPAHGIEESPRKVAP